MKSLLSVRPRINELTFRVYARSLHPELLETHAARVIERKEYKLHVGITSAGHVIRFELPDCQLVEVATSSHHDLPQQGQLLNQKIGAPFEQQIDSLHRIRYSCSVNLETLEPKNLFAFTQIIDKADREHSLVHQFGSNGRIAMGAMSFLKIGTRMQTVRIQAIHSFPDTCQVLTSQSMFEINAGASGNEQPDRPLDEHQ